MIPDPCVAAESRESLHQDTTPCPIVFSRSFIGRYYLHGFDELIQKALFRRGTCSCVELHSHDRRQDDPAAFSGSVHQFCVFFSANVGDVDGGVEKKDVGQGSALAPHISSEDILQFPDLLKPTEGVQRLQ